MSSKVYCKFSFKLVPKTPSTIVYGINANPSTLSLINETAVPPTAFNAFSYHGISLRNGIKIVIV